MRLVLQGPHLAPEHLQHIARLCNAPAPSRVAEQAFCLYVSSRNEDVSTYCETHRIDCAFVPNALTLDQFGLVVMDMDSTLINIESIDEIADMLGLKAQIAAITELAMCGEIEFAESLRQRVALLQGLDESALQRVYDERMQLNPGAQTLINSLKSRGIRTLLVSGGFSFFTDRLKPRIGLDYAHANTLEIINGKLTGKIFGDILDAQGKADWLIKTRDHMGLRPEQVIAIGDGANDLKMMSAAGVAIAYHAKPIVREQATFALNHTGLDGLLNLFTSGN